MKIKVEITLKPDVLDPQGQAVMKSLQQLSFSGVTDVRVGKMILIEMDTDDTTAAIQQAKQMSERLLANPVIENFTVAAK